MARKKLYELATVIRSKNSGPFEITLDVLFDSPTTYAKVKQQEVITKKNIAKLYHLQETMITNIVFYDPALGFKVTFDRKVSSGTCFDRDVYGAQQHTPLGELFIEV